MDDIIAPNSAGLFSCCSGSRRDYEPALLGKQASHWVLFDFSGICASEIWSGEQKRNWKI